MDVDGLPGRLQARLARGRAAARARMLSRVDVRRRTGLQAQNEATGRQAPTWETVHADVPFRLDLAGSDQGASDSSARNISEVRIQDAAAIGHLPHDLVDLVDGDLLEVISGERVGTVWKVVESETGDQQTARRPRIVQAQRPSEWEA